MSYFAASTLGNAKQQSGQSKSAEVISFVSASTCRRCTRMTALLVSADQFYWKTLTRLLVVLCGLDRKKDTGLLVSRVILTIDFTFLVHPNLNQIHEYL